MARGPGTLGGADTSRWGERTQTAEQKAGAGLCAVNSTASLAIGHQLLATVLVFPGHLSPEFSLDSSKETSTSRCLNLPSCSIATCPELDTNLQSWEFPVSPTPAGRYFLIAEPGPGCVLLPSAPEK